MSPAAWIRLALSSSSARAAWRDAFSSARWRFTGMEEESMADKA